MKTWWLVLMSRSSRDSATTGLGNSGYQSTGDLLLVYVTSGYATLVVVRNGLVIFYRNRPADAAGIDMGDLVHQTAMYYEDRLSGRGFARVLLGGTGRSAGAVEGARRSLEERLGTRVEPIDPTVAARPTDPISVSAETSAALAPLLGILLRTRREAVGA